MKKLLFTVLALLVLSSTGLAEEQPVQKEFKTSFNDYAEFVRSIDYKFGDIVSEINYIITLNN